VQGILAAEKLARLDCASILISSPHPKRKFSLFCAIVRVFVRMLVLLRLHACLLKKIYIFLQFSLYTNKHHDQPRSSL
jgi:hypothetical protein